MHRNYPGNDFRVRVIYRDYPGNSGNYLNCLNDPGNPGNRGSKRCTYYDVRYSLRRHACTCCTGLAAAHSESDSPNKSMQRRTSALLMSPLNVLGPNTIFPRLLSRAPKKLNACRVFGNKVFVLQLRREIGKQIIFERGDQYETSFLCSGPK